MKFDIDPDFGKTASDYGRYRAGFPAELYDRLQSFGVGLEGQRLLDLGTGTGYLVRGFAELTTAQMHTEWRRLDGN